MYDFFKIVFDCIEKYKFGVYVDTRKANLWRPIRGYLLKHPLFICCLVFFLEPL